MYKTAFISLMISTKRVCCLFISGVLADYDIDEIKQITVNMELESLDVSGGATSDSSKNTYSASSYPDYPKKLDFPSTEDYNKAVKNFFEVKGFKHIDNFSEDEKKEIVEDCVMNLIGPKTLCQKHNTLTHVICTFVREKGYQVPPEDLSNHPDFPKKSDDISDDDYKTILKKYWKDRRKQKKNTKT